MTHALSKIDEFSVFMIMLHEGSWLGVSVELALATESNSPAGE